jgi:hypothetical protein
MDELAIFLDRGPLDDKRRTLQEVCELATKEFDTHRLSAQVEEILELLAESNRPKQTQAPTARKLERPKQINSESFQISENR